MKVEIRTSPLTGNASNTLYELVVSGKVIRAQISYIGTEDVHSAFEKTWPTTQFGGVPILANLGKHKQLPAIIKKLGLTPRDQIKPPRGTRNVEPAPATPVRRGLTPTDVYRQQAAASKSGAKGAHKAARLRRANKQLDAIPATLDGDDETPYVVEAVRAQSEAL